MHIHINSVSIFLLLVQSWSCFISFYFYILSLRDLKQEYKNTFFYYLFINLFRICNMYSMYDCWKIFTDQLLVFMSINSTCIIENVDSITFCTFTIHSICELTEDKSLIVSFARFASFHACFILMIILFPLCLPHICCWCKRHHLRTSFSINFNIKFSIDLIKSLKSLFSWIRCS